MFQTSLLCKLLMSIEHKHLYVLTELILGSTSVYFISLVGSKTLEPRCLCFEMETSMYLLFDISVTHNVWNVALVGMAECCKIKTSICYDGNFSRTLSLFH